MFILLKATAQSRKSNAIARTMGSEFVEELDRQFSSSIYLLIHDPIEFVKYHQELTTPNVKPSPRATKAQDLSPITDRY